MSGRAWIAFISLGLIWGVPYFFIKLAVQEMSPFVVACSRLLLASAILLPVAWRRGALRSVGTHLAPICAFAVVEFVIPFSAISLGEQWIGSSVTAILIAMVPLTVVLSSRFFGLHERLGPWRAAGLVLGLVGVVALVGFGPITGLWGWIGVGCMVLAAVGYAVGPLIAQRYLADMDSIGPVAASLSVACLVLLPVALFTLPRHWPTPVALVSVAVLGVVCTAFAMMLMFFLIRSAGASRATIITYINPAVASLLGVLVLHERLGLGGMLAFVLILLGSWLATRKSAHGVAQCP
ncbi:MAG TPA: DMT family transporter [Steroidobacteraceae bacterium]